MDDGGLDAGHYNIDRYHKDVNAGPRDVFRDRPPVRVGQQAPRFALPTVDGGTCALEALLADGHVVCLFGSFSAPPCLMERPALERLAARADARFVFVYTREIHPGERLPPHRSPVQKTAQARAFRDHLGLAMPVCVDDLDGAVHRAFGGMPFMSVVVHRGGTVVHRSEWASAAELERFLGNLAERDAARASGRSGRLSWTESLVFVERDEEAFADLLALAGEDAVADHAGSHHPPPAL
jgi:hypothetical protein